MAVAVKICGVNSEAALAAAVANGASALGFNFYPPSPRAIDAGRARALTAMVPPGIVKIGLFVDAGDETIAAVLAAAALDMLQLHGDETPRRVKDIRRRFGLPVMKAVKLASATDVAAADAYIAVADRLLFDAKPPPEMKGALPGGNAISFEWSLIAGRSWALPWLLSGGLHAGNLAAAIAATGATAVDLSSGVEDSPGRKNPEKIAAFLRLAATL
ncbi:MAG TPA: phosphoribosylanthranilate isomerase [Dongiaceae bacterium]|nr:phosphoribosylanthranilate isomerase [Dongiaceae bacterium]